MSGSAELVVEALTARIVAEETSQAFVDSAAALKALACKALGGRGAELVDRPAEHRDVLLDGLRDPCPALLAAAREVLASLGPRR